MSFERWERFVKETAQQLKKEPKKQRGNKRRLRDQQQETEDKTWTKERRNFDGPIKENGTERTGTR